MEQGGSWLETQLRDSCAQLTTSQLCNMLRTFILLVIVITVSWMDLHQT